MICEGVSAGAGAEGTAGGGAGAIVWVMPGVAIKHANMTAAGEQARIIRFIIKCILDLIPGFIIY